MATIIVTSISKTSSALVTSTTLDGIEDTFTLTSGGGLLILFNGTGGDLTPIIKGDGSTTVTCSGVGVIDVSDGTDIFGTILDGTEKVLKVNIVKDYLQGVIEITGGTGLTARLLESS